MTLVNDGPRVRESRQPVTTDTPSFSNAPTAAPVEGELQDAVENRSVRLSTGERDTSLPDTHTQGPRSGDRARFARLAQALDEVTRNKVHLGHAGGLLLDVALLFFSGGAFSTPGIRALPGGITPEEANALVEKAGKFPVEDQRVLAVALEDMMRNTERFDFHRDRPTEEGGEIVESGDIVRRYIDSVDMSAATPAERAMGSLMAEVIQMRVAIDSTHTEVSSAERADPPEAVRANRVDITTQGLDRLEASLRRVPPQLRGSAKNNLLQAFHSHDWPDSAFKLETISRLASILSDNAEAM